MAELEDRDDTEEKFLLALLALFGRHTTHDDDAETELRTLLMYWTGLIFVQSAMQHGAPRHESELQASTWVLGHVIRVTSEMRRYSRQLQDGGLDVFSEERAARTVITETSTAAAAGAEFAGLFLGFRSEDDTWYTVLDERVCPYCGPLHGQPRKRWLGIYQESILPGHPEFAVYGPPERPPAHVNCRCFIVYASGAGE